MTIANSSIDHVGVQVSDLDAAITFLQDAFGLEVGQRVEIEARGLRTAFLGWGAASIELVEVARADPGAGRPVDHFAISVPDVRAVDRELRALGAKSESEPVEVGGRLTAFLRLGPVGDALLQVLERPPS